MIRVLCLDIEGGHGGSSRSLYHSLRFLDRGKVAPEVIVRRPGAIETLYRELDIPVRVMPKLPKASALQDWRANLRLYAGAARDMYRARGLLAVLADDIRKRFDAVHFNHEGYWMIVKALRPRTEAAFVMHIRTLGYGTALTRFEARQVGSAVDQLVFITENERDRFRKAGVRTAGTVVHNIANPPSPVEKHPAIPGDGKFTIACLANFSWGRGLDRLITIAECLAQSGRQDVRFVVAGEMTLPRNLPGTLGEIGRRGGTLVDYAEVRGVASSFVFLGHVPDPERVLAGSDLLIKPTRESNPWGRDILEALAAAKPVATIGTYAKFVEDGKTGILFEKFDPGLFAARLASLADDRKTCAAMGEAGRVRVAELCDGPARSRDLAEIWKRAVKSSKSTRAAAGPN